MVKNPLHMALCLVIMLAFQSLAAAGFSGCRHADQSGHAMHDMNSHGHHLYQQQHDTDSAYKPDNQSGCNCDCNCAMGCMHGCQGQALDTSILVILPDAISNVPAIVVNDAVPGFSFPLLRPPSFLNRHII